MSASAMGDAPLVSCIMPTAGRRACVPRAVAAFLAQDYPARELVVLDGGPHPVADLIPDDPRVRYLRHAGPMSLGARRNACVALARGDLIMHWDDDDWMAPRRISRQVAALRAAGAEICGLRRLLFHEPAGGATWLYAYPPDARPWLAGGTLLYTRAFWRRAPFPDQQLASDTSFVWAQPLERAVALDDLDLYVALIHPGNTSPKERNNAYWAPWDGDLRAIVGAALDGLDPAAPAPPAYAILMAVHNAREVVQLATLRALRHSAGQAARLAVVDNGSDDGVERWLALLAERGAIDLLTPGRNLGHGPALELARAATAAPLLVTLDSDAFPLADGWLAALRARLDERTRAAGIMHHRGYVHPACLMLERRTLDEHGLSFLAEKDRPSGLDVAERISVTLKERGFALAGLARGAALRRGSRAEPVDLGASYEGLVYHQWYTTRAATAAGGPVDDVPADDLQGALAELLAAGQAAPRELTVVVGVRAAPGEPERLRNALACLKALNLQDLPRWRYRLVVVEQDSAPRHREALAPLADRYVFAYNPGPYNRGWGLNLGAAEAAGALCLLDADLPAPPDLLSRGLAALREGRRAALPYAEICYLDGPSTARAIADPPLRRLMPDEPYAGRVFTTSQGGAIFVEAALYHSIGGHDEGFRGWGREDREFWDRLTQATAVARLPGRLLHLDHPRPPMEDAWAAANQARYERIAAGAPAEPPGPIGDPGRYSHETPDEWEPGPAVPRPAPMDAHQPSASPLPSAGAGQGVRAPGPAPRLAAGGAWPAGPTVSVIMPTYRRPHTLGRAVAGVLAQTYGAWELIIVDNAGDCAYEPADPRIRLVRHAERASASAARNAGLAHATGDLVCFFDDDDEMFPHYLERFAAALRANPLAMMARCGMVVSDGGVNYSYATPECCLRRAFATPTWAAREAHDQLYFAEIMSLHRWSEARGDIILIPEALCRAHTDPRGGLRSGGL